VSSPPVLQMKVPPSGEEVRAHSASVRPPTSLDHLKAGEQGRVTGLVAPLDVRRRLLEMGLTPGTLLRVVRFAPLGDPIDVEVRGYHLSLRKHEAQHVMLSKK
jgi:ferrous iron transport protein A